MVFDYEVTFYGCYGYVPLSFFFQGEAENHGTIISYNTTVVGGHIENNMLHLHIAETKGLENNTGNSQVKPQLMLTPSLIINSAGLSAVPLAKRFVGLSQSIVPDAYYARGCYFTLSQMKRPPFCRLIYPLPEEGGIGVHVTIDLNGLVKFGPDVEWIDGIDDLACFLNRQVGFIIFLCIELYNTYSDIKISCSCRILVVFILVFPNIVLYISYFVFKLPCHSFLSDKISKLFLDVTF